MSIDNAPKKILFVSRPIAPPWDEASKNFAYNLAREVSASNSELEVHLMTSQNLPNLPNNIIQENIYKFFQKDFKFSDKLRSILFQFKNKNKFDIAQYFFTPTKLNSFLIKNLLKGKNKTIQTIATLREDLFSDADIKNMMFGDVVITYSEYTKNKLQALGVNNVIKIYPGISFANYYPRAKSEAELKRANFQKDNFILGFAGEYVRLGAMDIVVDSFIEISQKIPEARLSLAVRVKNEKDAQKKEEVMAKLKKENLLEKVSFHDDCKYEMSDLYNLCDISLFPIATMQGKFDIPLVVIEAMACAKPVIVSDIPILKEFSNDANSVSVRSGSREDLTRAILDLYNDLDKRIAIGKNAQTYVTENFNIQKSAQQYLDLYNSL